MELVGFEPTFILVVLQERQISLYHTHTLSYSPYFSMNPDYFFCYNCKAEAKIGSIDVDADRCTFTMICPNGHGVWLVTYKDKYIGSTIKNNHHDNKKEEVKCGEIFVKESQDDENTFSISRIH